MLSSSNDELFNLLHSLYLAFTSNRNYGSEPPFYIKKQISFTLPSRQSSKEQKKRPEHKKSNYLDKDYVSKDFSSFEFLKRYITRNYIRVPRRTYFVSGVNQDEKENDIFRKYLDFYIKEYKAKEIDVVNELNERSEKFCFCLNFFLLQ